MAKTFPSFLAGLIAIGMVIVLPLGGYSDARQSVRSADAVERTRVDIRATDGVSLQQTLDRHAEAGVTLQLAEPTELTCPVQERAVPGEMSRHALLIPAGVHLDLNGSTLLLNLRSNSHGVRLSNRSGIRNGTIRIAHSAGKGSQAIWHSAISVGSAYDDGGTPAEPSVFSRVSDWEIEDITIDQPFAAAAIQLMSEACHGVIRGVRILDSPQALLGIGMDWGRVGKANTADEKIPQMRELWEQKEFYSTHPHDILIEDLRVGNLTRNVDANDAGIRCSACYNIEIRDVHITSAAAAVAIFGGDCGFEFAPSELRPLAHRGYRIENVVIDQAFRCGFVLNGLADNVYRSNQNHGYRTLIDPAQPGLNDVRIVNCRLTGTRAAESSGAFITAVSNARFEQVTLQNFDRGVRIKDWIDGLQFKDCNLSANDEPRSISAMTQMPRGLVFEDSGRTTP